MSVVTPAEAGLEESRPTSPTARTIWRSGRMIVLMGVALVLIGLLVVMLRPAQGPERYLDPDDTSLSGSKAIAELLRDRGVTVKRTDSAEAAAANANAAAGDHLLLITDTTYQDRDALAEIPGDRLIVGVPSMVLHDLAPEARAAPVPARTRSREPSCGLPAATAAGSAFMGGAALRGPSGTTGCYPVGRDGHALITYSHAGGVTTVVGAGDFLTNQRLAEDGNAALALNLVGTGRTVTWLVRPQDPPPLINPGDAGLSMHDLMPGSIRWGIYMAIIALAVTAFWRGRRLGPVVTEKLPVIVRASETVEGRGRLYRARRARDRAAGSLRAGTIDRLTPRLGLDSGAGQHEVVAAIAARTGENPQAVGTALYGPPPADDAGLVGLAGYLDLMERQISELR
ncbi:DUF4350 domain-containing protein [Nonomuraea sp. NPDC050404]|uniref:DUF4350 domain-containing protein n=1 Tax=Nonomuraea sp. NPDC050404 TaxID=3155783 RepID=UPI0033C222DA